MALVDRLLERRSYERSLISDPAAWLVAMFGGRATATGRTVTPATAIEAPSVFSAVAAVSETIGSLSLDVFRRLPDGGKREDPDHPLFDLLHTQPNPEQTAMTWREMLQAHAMLWGNAYSEIQRNDTDGRVTAIWPIFPDRVRIERRAGQLVYIVNVQGLRGATAVDEIAMPAYKILHLRGLSLDGLLGVHRVRLLRDAIGHTQDLEEYGARFFGNDATPGGVLEHPARLGPQGRANLRQSWEELHGNGLSNRHRLAILEEGMKFHEISVENEKAQFLQTRQYQLGEMARGFRVPGVVIGHDDKTATYASAKEFWQAYEGHTVRPWVVRWDQALEVSLLTPLERKTHFIRHNIDSLLRADPQARAESLRTQFLHATITPNEWRRLEGRNPSADPNADKLWIQANLMPLDTPPKPPPSAPEPPPVQPMTPDEMPDDVRRMIELGGLLSRDNAARVVRREVETVRKLAEREAADAEAWRTAVDQFYARHAAYIAELLHVSLDAARTYTADHRARLLADGVGALESWNGDAEQALIALALGRGKG